MLTLAQRRLLALVASCLPLILLFVTCGGTAQPAAATPSKAAPATPAATAVAPQSAPTAQPAKSPVTIKISDHFPVAHVIPTNFTKAWIARVEELANGQAKFQYFPAEQLVKQVDALGALQKKLVDISLVNPALFPTEFPLTGVLVLPSGYDSVTHGGRAIGKFLAVDAIAAEFRKNGVRVASLIPFEGMEVIATKQVVYPDDAKGLKLRSAGEGAMAAVRAIGATPVSMSMPEVYTAIQRNSLDGAQLPFSATQSYKMAEVTKFTTSGASTSYGIVMYMMNEAFWTGLDPNVQKAITQATDELMPKGWAAMDAAAQTGKQYMAKEGAKVTEIQGAIKAVWDEKMKPAKQQWAQSMESKGLPGNQVLAAWDKTVADTRQ